MKPHRENVRLRRRSCSDRSLENTGRLPRSKRRLLFESLEIRLPLAADGLAGDADSVFWQGREVSANRGEWIVHFDEASGQTDVHGLQQIRLGPLPHGTDSRLHAAALEVGHRVGGSDNYLFRFRHDLPSEVLQDAFSMTPGFGYAEPNFVLSTDVVPNDPEYSRLWGLHDSTDNDIDAPEAWDLTTGSPSLVVGVIDTGVDYQHEDLAGNMWTNPVECPAGMGTCVADGIDDDGNGYIDDFYGWDFINNDNDPFDDHSHGTHVAGTVAAVGNNNTGTVGVNWNAQIMALKFIGSNGNGSTSDAIEAIEYATKMKRDHGVNIPITNNSWGGGDFSQALKDAIDESRQQGMLFVAAAGNDAQNTEITPHYPSSYDLDNIISVASTTSNDGRSSFSNYGAISVDLGAPGSSIYSTTPLDSYGYKSGTSMASPHVAGVAALAWATDPNATYTDVRSAILSSVDPIPSMAGVTVTGGRLNAFATLQQMGLFATAVSPAEAEVVSAAPTSFTVDFSDPVDATTVDAADFAVGAIAADSFNVVDADTVEFTFVTSPVTIEGLQTMTLAAGSITRLADADGVSQLTADFYYDPTPLQVVAVTPTDGSVLSLPDPILRLDFSEPFAPGSIGTGDLTLSAGRVTSFSIIDSDTVEYQLTNLTLETPLSVDLPPGAVTDVFGIPNQPLHADFELDFGTTNFPGTFAPLAPAGSLIYQAGIPGTLPVSTDTDTYTVDLDAGQSWSAALQTSGTLAGTLRILDPGDVELAASSGGVGDSIVLQSQAVTVAGTYSIVVETDGATSGDYTLELSLNAAVEEEHFGGSSNDTLGSAQDVGSAWTIIGSGASRVGIVGNLSSGSDDDWFELTLDSSQPTTIVLETVSSGVAVTLHEPGGNQIVAGVTDGDQLRIDDFQTSSSGSYFVKISGAAADYSLVATRGSSFDHESNDSLAEAQGIDSTLTSLGHLGTRDVVAAGVGQSGSGVEEEVTDLGGGLTIHNDLLEDAIVQQQQDVTRVIWGEAQNPRLLMAATNVTEHFVSIDSAPEGDITRDVVYTPDGTKFLIAHRDSENVLVYNATTHAVEADIPVAGQPVSVAVTPNGQYAVSANTAGDTVTVIDLATLTKVADVPVSSSWPYRVKVTPDSQHAVVATAGDAYSVISLNTLQEVRSIASPGLGSTTFSFNTGRAGIIILGYTDFAITPDGNKLIGSVTEGNNDTIRIYDLNSGNELAALQATRYSRNVTISSDGTKAYFGTSVGNSGTITEVDLTTNTIARTLATAQLSGNKIALTPDEQFMIAGGFNKLIFIDLADGSTDATAGVGSVDDFAISHDGKYVLSRWVVDIQTRAVVGNLPTFLFLELIATSPTELKGIQATKTASHRFSVVNIDGANAALEANLPGGSLPEGDAPTALAVSPDGLTAVTANWESNNVSIVDLQNRTVLAWVDVGTRPDGVAITPDGNHAVVTNASDDSLSVIDLTTHTVVATLTGLASDPRHVVVSGDSSQAFVSTTGDSNQQDKVYFIDLAGAASSVSGSLTIGDMATEVAQYTELTLSPDSSLLAAPATRDDEIVLVDTATKAEIARLPTGDYPSKAVFSQDGSRLYVLNETSNSVTVIAVDGANSSVEANILGLTGASDMVLGEAEQFLYVASNFPSAVEVIDATTLSVVQTVDIDSDARPWRMTRNDNVLYIVGSEGIPVGTPLLDDAGRLMRVVADGPSSFFVDDTLLSGRTRVVSYSSALKSAVTTTYNNDGLDVVSYEFEASGDEDFYHFLPQVGDEVTVSTTTPGSSPGQFENELDLAVELFDSNGNLVAQGAAGTVNHTITSLGPYSVRLYAQAFSQGEYQMSVSGVTQLAGPSITALSPLDGATDVSLDSQLVMTFDKPVLKGTGNISIRRTDDDTVLVDVDVTSGLVTVVGDTVTVDPGVPWELDTSYYVLVDSGALNDINSNPFAGINDKTLWDFSIGFGHDFGDAPVPFPVTTAESGARHAAIAGPQLGPQRDSEFDGVHSAAADADDLAGSDDEDGVTFGSIHVGQVDATVTVNVQGAAGGAQLDAWIDFDGDGFWGGALEQIADSVPVADGDNVIEFDVPSWALDGTTYARFRLSTAGDAGIIGNASDGEVEDHVVTIAPPVASSGFIGGKIPVAENSDGGTSIFPVDMDADGDVDIVTARGTTQYLVWFENDGNGGFTERQISNDRFSAQVFAIDVDGDGDMDVVTTTFSFSDTVRWYENDGNQSFTKHEIDASLNNPDSVFAGDVNQDGHIDVVVMEYLGSSLVWFQNDGNQNFTKHQIATGVAAESMGVIDLDRDGDLDVLSNAGGTTWYENNAGVFTAHDISTGSAYRIHPTDVDGDGDIDVLQAVFNKVAWLENDGNQNFTVRTIAPANQSRAIYGTDLDGDGDMDVISRSVLGNGSVDWLENDGNQNFTPHPLATSLGVHKLRAGDLDGDGDMDVISASQSGDSVYWYENQNGIPPQLVSLTPAHQSTVIATDTNLVMQFDEPVQEGIGEISIHKVSDNSVVETFDVGSALVTVAGSSVTVDPTSNLDADTEYYVLVGSQVIEDTDGNSFFGIDHSSLWSFTTQQIGVDYGDAPDGSAGTGTGNYNTIITDNGPSHTILAGLYMGHTVDADDGTLQNVSAVADDADQLFPDDEDGLNSPQHDLLLTIGAQPTVSVLVTNTTGAAATLSGWIDYDNNGLFDLSERAQIAVAGGTFSAPVTLTFPVVPGGYYGQTYARFRLGSDAAAADPTGASAGGEVEDYVVTILAPSVPTPESVTKISHQQSGGPTLADSDEFGSALAPLGDLDGDGVVDMAIGSPRDDDGGTDSGAVYIALMNSDGSIKSQQAITMTSDNLPLGSFNNFGFALAPVGDLDLDGVNDLAVLTRRTGGSSQDSIHFLFLNSDGTLKSHQNTRVVIDGRSPSLASVTAVGDLNKDGIVDLALGAPNEVVNGIDSGAVYIMFLDNDGTAKGWQKIGHQFGGGPTLGPVDFFGEAVTSIGDLNGDAVPDLAVGAYFDDTGVSSSGAVYILFMNPNGTVSGFQKIAHQTGGGPTLNQNDGFGRSLISLGDLNADGVTDLFVGAPGRDVSTGAAYILMLNADGTVQSHSELVSNTGGIPALDPVDSFGHSGAGIGDLNGDGQMEVAIGARKDDDGGTDRGAVYVLFLDNGPLAVTDVILEDGSDQRSIIREITVKFNEIATIDAGAFDLETADGIDVIVSPTISTVDGKTEVLLTFSGPEVDATGSLNDNNYQITILDTHIRDAHGQALDGDSDGQAGGPWVDEFFKIFGDEDGNRHVNLFDFAGLRDTYGLDSTHELFDAAFDHNDNDLIDLFDFAQFRDKYGTSMPE